MVPAREWLRQHRRRLAGLAALAPVCALLAGFFLTAPASASVAARDDSYSQVGTIHGYEGLCMDLRSNNVSDYAAVQVYTCNGTAAQQWVYDNTNGSVHLAENSNYCLDNFASITGDGNKVDLYQCNGTGAQVWAKYLVNNTNVLKNLAAGKCLDDTGWGGSGTQLQIWDCAGTANQSWVWQY